MNQKRQAPFQGSLKASHLPIAVMIIATIGIAFSYIAAQIQGSEPPFPHASITSNSNHYPQYIVFRITEEGSALFIIFIWLIEYVWIRQKAQETGVTLIFPQLQAILGAISGILFIFSTATIDTGKMNSSLHGHCATWFFITLMVNFLLNFLSFVQFKCKNEMIINENSFYTKLLINMCDVVLLVLESKDIPNYDNIQEYLGVLFMCIYMGTFALDWKGYYIEFNIQNPKLISLVREEPQLRQEYAFVQQPQIYYVPQVQQQIQQQTQFLQTVHAQSPMGQALAASIPQVQAPVLNIQPLYSHQQPSYTLFTQKY
ncbi:Frag1/DRAM/Sfk1 family protein (macronuclear) [Tetrahymena thermophila SB210]|uniref:Frag1/DRAM/Sfk1 family protein n=1 Tax=Tetrahymena thermophila (strain SB210) TaxID=312017 RepID=Q23RL9_TETTS|nr:Frag1/DRAM/Sfk1 family protein [Tetrahymena thermophila SB210]EAR99029.3 Frag1/DRAM/Sfk1 family protein [Tetrahymena thermophila SB210]|eukprot:XP_001019274.3 Frag1/DRAM/Sfk1 family protein [Tetrahymena thermophila SB210]